MWNLAALSTADRGSQLEAGMRQEQRCPGRFLIHNDDTDTGEEEHWRKEEEDDSDQGLVGNCGWWRRTWNIRRITRSRQRNLTLSAFYGSWLTLLPLQSFGAKLYFSSIFMIFKLSPKLSLSFHIFSIIILVEYLVFVHDHLKIRIGFESLEASAWESAGEAGCWRCLVTGPRNLRQSQGSSWAPLL